MPPFSPLDMHILTLQMQDAHVFHELDYATPPRTLAAHGSPMPTGMDAAEAVFSRVASAGMPPLRRMTRGDDAALAQMPRPTPTPRRLEF